MENRMSLEFDAKSENESFARMTAAAFVASANPTAPELAEIKTAVSEAVTNAIIHGYENSEGIVKMEGKISGKMIEFTVTDEGWGIEDVEKARMPLYTGKPELERSGMGFSIMESFMDNVEIESAPGMGTRIRLVKNLEI
ncbi:MAG: anti-sigma F factor [Ruminococcaceae bacterium]|nr:anti-sigma F factor [Oscillospiraceae bacterium]